MDGVTCPVCKNVTLAWFVEEHGQCAWCDAPLTIEEAKTHASQA